MAKSKLEEGQLVLCTVTKIVGTTVFVHIDNYNLEGSITFMEIAPGRIRNIREYAFPGKKIVCKILEIKSNQIELSFRRVKVNERNDFNDRHKKEKSYSALIKTVLGENFDKISQKIKENENSLFELIETAKQDLKVLEKYISKEQAEKIISILKSKKIKEKVISQKFSLSSKTSNGIVLAKKIIKESSENINEKEIEISYIAAGKYLIKIKAKDPRIADQQLRKFLETLEKLAKKNSCVFGIEKS